MSQDFEGEFNPCRARIVRINQKFASVCGKVEKWWVKFNVSGSHFTYAIIIEIIELIIFCTNTNSMKI